MRTGQGSRWVARWRPEILLVALVLVVAGPIVQLLMAHQASRLAFSAAVWDEGTVRIDTYEPILGVDFAERAGHLYSDKAPGQPFLAAPFYGLARAAGAEPAETERFFDNLTLWWTSFWSATVPAAALAVMMRRLALGTLGDPRAATAAAVTVSLGTLLLPFATVLFSHVLAATLCFAAYLAGRDRDAPPLRLAAAGLLGGMAVVTEYTAGIVVVVLGVLILLRRGVGVASYVAGGLPAVGLLAVYNAVAWGSPTEFSYANSGSFASAHEQGFFGVRVPEPVLTAQVLFGERGLLTLTPIVLVGVIGLGLLASRRRTREVGVVGLVVFALFAALQGGWFSVTAGASPGPRYAVVALPFVAVGVAQAWRWSRATVVIAGAVGAVPMLMAIFTNPLAQPSETFTAGHWAWRIVEGRWGQTLLTPHLPAPWAQLLQLAVAAGVLALLWRATTGAVPPAVRDPATLPEDQVEPNRSSTAAASRSAASGSALRNSDGSMSSSSSSSGPSDPSTRSTRA
jgi:hypothetical protein